MLSEGQPTTSAVLVPRTTTRCNTECVHPKTHDTNREARRVAVPITVGKH